MSKPFNYRAPRSDFDSKYGEKGQKRSAKPKPSGAASLKRAAKKRNNVRRRSAK